MAEAEAELSTKVECGFCFCAEDELTNPKSLPCSHVHCSRCLHISLSHSGVLQCPHQHCREVFDIPIEKLPAYTIGGNNSACDICVKKGKGNQTAAVYCISCCKKYCAKHQKSHDDVLIEHPKIPIGEYLGQANKLQVIDCDEHSGLSCALGCSDCLKVFCVECVASKESCQNGKAHELVTLAELVDQLHKETDELKVQIMEREEKLSFLFKTASKVVLEFEEETEEMVYALRKTRNEQMEAIETKYSLLEQELIERRHKSKVQIAEFMEGNVGLKLMDLSKHRLNIEAWFKHSHQVEIIRKYQELREKLKQLLTEDLPALEVQYLASIHTTDTSRDVEVEITSEEDGKISWDKGFTISKPLPKSVTLIKDNHMPSNCRSVCCYKGNTYVGLDDYSVARVDEHYHITISLVRFANFVDAIVVYNDRIYSLVHGNPYMIHVHDLTGNPITQWQHSDNATYGYGSKLTIISDQIIVSDRLNQRLTVYSLNGETIKNVPCSQLGTGAVAICAAGDNDIIVSNTNARLVFRFNMSTGIVVWTATPIQSPQGVIPYRKNFVCVVSQSTRSVHVLNIKTGEQVSQFTDANITNNTYFDLEVSGRNLIIPKSGTTSLLFYRMSTQPNA